MGSLRDIHTIIDGKGGDRITEKSVGLQKKRKETVSPIVEKNGAIDESLFYDESSLPHEALYKYYIALDKFGGDITTCGKIFVPSPWETNHWFLFIVDFIKKKILIYDSMRSVTTEAPKRALVSSLRLGLHESLQEGYSNQYKHDTDTFSIDVVNWCPQQTNNHGCGIYVTKFMDNIENLNPQFQLKELRLSDCNNNLIMAFEISPTRQNKNEIVIDYSILGLTAIIGSVKELELGNLWVAHKLFFPPPPSDFVIVVVGGALVKITRTSLKNLNRPYYSCPKNLVSDSLNVLVMNECPNIIIFFQPCKDGLPGVMKQKATTSSFS
ncbi:hypothetical protein M9H77_16191 [Catharanthus roseus]|uniref:Uncharacterized protein n=1 Tax=Catharanthus roseus TaxID=4058 RepID=A0ACC0B196_CATRO|nr:hypothetical protein M9H77_16191 [Catharanthus roseus]